MVRKLLEIAVSVVFAMILGFVAQLIYLSVFSGMPYLPFLPWVISGICGIAFYFSISNLCADLLFKAVAQMEDKLLKMNVKELSASVFGIFVGLVIANLIGMAVSGFGFIGAGITVILNIVLGFLGFRVARKKKDEISVEGIRETIEKESVKLNKKDKEKKTFGRPKILDTSVIIDGRILDLLQTGFIEGKIIIPSFVLDELRHIADSADSLKRNRGRRGLDILNEIQKQLSVPVEIVNYSVNEPLEVDSMLLKMAEETDSFVVTNDFNLNKVAEFRGVKALNINELANAIKPVVLPGEEMEVTIIKEGKENSQGVAYLNDGTMIVVEGGGRHIGETMTVSVTSVLQTAAGRMIFTKMTRVAK